MSKVFVVGALVVMASWQVTNSSPICRSCTKHCYQNGNATSLNSTDTTDLLEDVQQLQQSPSSSSSHHRRKREAEVEFRACTRFQVEMLLIPLSIAMIPIILCALIMCTCCCGPKESRGKLPDDFLASFPMSKKRSQMNSEDMELEFRDGYVQRKDSARTKFSTVVSYIEARRESQWSVRTDGGASTTGADPTDDKEQPETSVGTTEASSDSQQQQPQQLRKASVDSAKRTRFSDTVSVISAESLCRR